MSRTVIVAHGHPAFGFGGGEIAAHRHFDYMRRQGADVYFVGAVRPPGEDQRIGEDENLTSLGERDFIVRTPPMSGYLLDFTDIADENRVLDALVGLEGDVYHFHHVWNVGAATITRLMRARPQTKFILTLHEYLSICALHGQMLKAGSNALCYAAEPRACAACLPEHLPSAFVLRRHRLLKLFDKFDLLITPSAFLRDRLKDWGVQAAIAVLENGMPPFATPDGQEDAALMNDKPSRFAFFGRHTPTKGLNILIAAAAELVRRGRHDLAIDVHGVTPEEFAASYPEMTPTPGIVRFQGYYRPHEVVEKMRDYGWVVVPSVWWENSPLVIQEARAAGVPVIVSNIGGMKEKADDWGRLFEVGNPSSLADVIEDSAGDMLRYGALRSRIEPPITVEDHHRDWARLVGDLAGRAPQRILRASIRASTLASSP